MRKAKQTQRGKKNDRWGVIHLLLSILTAQQSDFYPTETIPLVRALQDMPLIKKKRKLSNYNVSTLYK